MNQDLEKKSDAKKSKKIGSQAKSENNENLPSTMSSDKIGSKLDLIQKQVNSIIERQNTGVSPEFNALMDGYVSKANESQTYKAKHDHLETLYEDLTIEIKNLREENKKYKSDFDASREALRLSEADLQRLRKESETNKMQYDEQISALVEEREKLRTGIKNFTEEKERLNKELADLKAELLEHKYKAKQLEQEKQVEIETHKRSVKDSNKVIEELREKLDLRTREVEYKDALLNQLIKQVSADDVTKDVLSNSKPFNPQQTSTASTSESHVFHPSQNPENGVVGVNKKGIEVKLDESPSLSQGSRWGAFRK